MSKNIRTFTLFALLVILVLPLSACQPLLPAEEAAPDADLRRVQGEIFLPSVPEWGGVTISMDFDFSEVDPDSHKASGYINWHNVMPGQDEGMPTWKGVESEARYVFFGEDAGDTVDAVVVIAQITAKDGWGQGEPGEYAYFWMRDGGDTGPDQWGMRYFSFDPFYEFYPEDSPPVEAGYFTLEDVRAEDPVLPLDVELGEIEIVRPALAAAATEGNIIEVLPTGEYPQDVTNVQGAIDAAVDGDTVLLRAGTFNFGDWRTNPLYSSYIVIDKGISLTGDGFNEDGTPKTVIQGGNFAHKNHWDQGEHGVVNFGGNAVGGVLENVWLKEPHFYGVFISGFNGQSHEDIAVRNVWVTDISPDIPEWAQDAAIGRSIDMGATVPDWDVHGPIGTITIENNTVSDLNSTLDMAFLDPDTGEPYYRNAEGADLTFGDLGHEQGSHGIGLWMNMGADFVVRGNTVQTQHEGIVLEYMSGSGDIVVEENDIVVGMASFGPDLQRGLRMTTCDPESMPYASERTVSIANNQIKVVGSATETATTQGMLLSNDNGLEGFAAKYTVTGNEIDIQDGDAAIVLGSVSPMAALRDADIQKNVIRGTADYGIYSAEAMHDCLIKENNMAELEAGVEGVELSGEGV